MSSTKPQGKQQAPRPRREQQPVRREVLEGHGTIKAVNSAVSVTIVGQPRGGPPPEIVVIFSQVDSPRFRVNGVVDKTAFALREAFRKFCIGKTCTFHTDTDVPSQGFSETTTPRRFGYVVLDEGEVNLTEWVLRNGLATVRVPRNIDRLPTETRDAITAYQELENAAKEDGLGLHDENLQTIETATTDLDINEFYSLNKGKKVSVLIEHVITASVFRAFIVFGERLYNFMIQLTNVSAADNAQQGPVAEEAKYFVETEILHRDVDVFIDACEFARLDCRVETPKGDLGEVLLLNGYARLVGVPGIELPEPSLTSAISQFEQARRTGRQAFRPLPQSALPQTVLQAYRKAQSTAQTEHKRIWKNWVPREEIRAQKPPPEDKPMIRSYYGVVTEVVSGDTIVVAPIDTKIQFEMGGKQYDWGTVLAELNMLPKQDSADDSESEELETKKGKNLTDEQLRMQKVRREQDKQRNLRRKRMQVFADGTALVKLENILMPEQRVSFASVTAPRLSMRPPKSVSIAMREEEGKGPLQTIDSTRSNPPQPPYAFEAREYLRTMLIGKIVAVNVEYRHSSQQDTGRFLEREFSTVMFNGENLGVLMVREGFAHPVRHRDDEERSRYYSQILKAEDDAIKHHRRLYQFEHELIQQQMDISRQAQEEAQSLRIRRKPRSQMTKQELEEEQTERQRRNENERARRDAVRTTLNKKLYDTAPIVRINDISGDARVNRQMQGLLTSGTSASSVMAASGALFTAPPYVPGTAGQQLALERSSSKPLRFRRNEDMLDAVVEQVLSPTRMKILIPKHHLLIMFCLEGLQSSFGPPPTITSSTTKTLETLNQERYELLDTLPPDERFARVSTEEARHLLLNRNVRIGLTRLAPNGRYWLGSMVLDGVDVSSIMVSAGLAYIPEDTYRELLQQYQSDKSKKSKLAEGSLLDMQVKAQARAIGYWELQYSKLHDGSAPPTAHAPQPAEIEEEEESDFDEDDYVGDEYGIQNMLRSISISVLKDGMPCTILDTVDPGAVLVQMGNNPTPKITAECDAILALSDEDPKKKDHLPYLKNPKFLPSKGQLFSVRVAVKDGHIFAVQPTEVDNQDVIKQWHRGRVESVDKKQKVVQFNLLDTQTTLDYPYSILPSVLMTLDDAYSTDKIPNCAFFAFLAFVKPVPNNEQLTRDGSDYLYSICQVGQIYCRSEYEDSDHRPYVTLVRVEKVRQKDATGRMYGKPVDNVTIINIEMTRLGYDITERPTVPPSHRRYVGLYLDAEDKAREAHTGAWKDGDTRSTEQADEETKELEKWKKAQKENIARRRQLAEQKKEAAFRAGAVPLVPEQEPEKPKPAEKKQPKQQKKAEPKAAPAAEPEPQPQPEPEPQPEPQPSQEEEGDSGEEEEPEGDEEPETQEKKADGTEGQPTQNKSRGRRRQLAKKRQARKNRKK